MDFELPPQLQELRARAREFAETHLRPNAARWDERQEFPTEAIAKLRGTPFLSMTIAKEYGGAQLGNLASCVVLEEFNRCCPSTGVTVSVHNSLMNSPLGKWGSPQQRQKYLPRLASGEWIGAYCLSEAGAGSDAAALRCAAKKKGDRWVLDGPKLWITTGEKADLFVVFARTGEHRTKGISAFLVERRFPGVRAGKKEDKLGIRGSCTNEVLLENCEVPAENMLGEEGQGFPIALDTLDGGRLGIASQALGITRAALEDSLEFVKTRTVDGKPMSEHQAFLWKLADIATALDASRMLTWRAAHLRDRGERCSTQAAMAKLLASRTCDEATREAVQIHGLEGCTAAHRVERYLRDARITEIYEGVTDIQRLVIARGILA